MERDRVQRSLSKRLSMSRGTLANPKKRNQSEMNEKDDARRAVMGATKEKEPKTAKRIRSALVHSPTSASTPESGAANDDGLRLPAPVATAATAAAAPQPIPRKPISNRPTSKGMVLHIRRVTNVVAEAKQQQSTAATDAPLPSSSSSSSSPPSATTATAATTTTNSTDPAPVSAGGATDGSAAVASASVDVSATVTNAGAAGTTASVDASVSVADKGTGTVGAGVSSSSSAAAAGPISSPAPTPIKVAASVCKTPTGNATPKATPLPNPTQVPAQAGALATVPAQASASASASASALAPAQAQPTAPAQSPVSLLRVVVRPLAASAAVPSASSSSSSSAAAAVVGVASNQPVPTLDSVIVLPHEEKLNEALARLKERAEACKRQIAQTQAEKVVATAKLTSANREFEEQKQKMLDAHARARRAYEVAANKEQELHAANQCLVVIQQKIDSMQKIKEDNAQHVLQIKQSLAEFHARLSSDMHRIVHG